MVKRYYPWVVVPALFLLLFLAFTLRPGAASAKQQFPMVDQAADKVVQKYMNSSCEQLWQKRAANTPPSPQQQKFIQLLKTDPAMRQEFINRVAAPIANKMFECNLIP